MNKDNQFFQLVRALSDRVHSLQEEIKTLDPEIHKEIYMHQVKNMQDTSDILFDLTSSKAPEFKALINK